MNENLLFFDFEIFVNKWIFVAFVNNEYKIISNRDEFLEFFNKYQNYIWIGYNNLNFDNYIIKAIVADLNIKEVSDIIINKKRNDDNKEWYRIFLNKVRDVKINLKTIDLMVWRGLTPLSLKRVLAGCGFNILEYRFTKELKAEDEIKAITYCINDVKHLPYILNNIKNTEIEMKINLINEYHLNYNYINRTKAFITSKILGARKVKRLINFNFNHWIDELQIENEDIYNFYNNELNYKKKLKIPHNDKNIITYKNNMTLIEAAIKAKKNNREISDYYADGFYTFGFGGLHLSRKISFVSNDNIEYEYMDVSSFYPTIMLNFDLLSRNCSSQGKAKFEKLVKDRLQAKKEDVDLKKDFLSKIILNSAFGAMKNKYNDLYDPEFGNAVPILGQLILWDLIEKLSAIGGDIIYVNTDAIIVKFQKIIKHVINDIFNEWKDRFRLKIVRKKIVDFVIKDTNNRILIFANGSFEARGDFLNNSSLMPENKNMWDHHMVVVANAVLSYLINRVDPKETINNDNNILNYQIIKSNGKTYSSCFWIKDNEKANVNLRINRIFASNNKNYGLVYKQKEKGNPEMIASLPKNCLVANDKLPDINEIDKSWYLKVAWNRINTFR